MIPERIEIFMQVVITLVCLLITLPLLLIAIRKYLRRNETGDKRFQLEKAVILTIELSGLVINQQTQVKLQVQVLPEKGRNFVAEIKEIFSLSALTALQTGDVMKVKYNPANIKEIFLVKQL